LGCLINIFMKIAILNSLYQRGGAEKVAQKMAQDLTDQGHEVFFVATKAKGQEKAINIRYSIYELNSLFPELHKYSYAFRLFWQMINLFNLHKYYQIKKILKKEKPDLAISHNLMGLGYQIPRLIKKLGIKHEHYLHDIQLLHPSGLMYFGQEKIIDSLGAKIYQVITRYLFQGADKIVSPSRWLIEIHSQRGFFRKSEKIVRPNFPLNQTPREKKDINQDKQRFLYVGQLEKHKGLELLIKAWLEADKKGELIIIGDGQEEKHLKEMVKNRADIVFFPYKEEKVKELMRNSDYLVVPSLVYENSPSVIYEAKQIGLTVIASSIGGIPELTTSQDILFQPGKQAELVRIIKDLNTRA